MSAYRCPECKGIVSRPSKAKTIKSYCSFVGKNVRLVLKKPK